jgi:hypothetical protein
MQSNLQKSDSASNTICKLRKPDSIGDATTQNKLRILYGSLISASDITIEFDRNIDIDDKSDSLSSNLSEEGYENSDEEHKEQRWQQLIMVELK